MSGRDGHHVTARGKEVLAVRQGERESDYTLWRGTGEAPHGDAPDRKQGQAGDRQWKGPLPALKLRDGDRRHRQLARRRCRNVKRASHRQPHIPDVTDTFPRVLLQAAAQVSSKCGGKFSRQLVPLGFRLDYSRHDLGDVVTVKRPTPGQHLVEHAAKRPDVGALVDDPALRLLGGHIRRRPDHHPHLRGRGGQRDRRRHGGADATRFRLEGFGQAEVQHLHGAVWPELDIRGLEIPMDDALLVRGFEGFRDLFGDGQRLVERD